MPTIVIEGAAEALPKIVKNVVDKRTTAQMLLETQIVSPPRARQALLVLGEYWRPIARRWLPISCAVIALLAGATIAFLVLQWRTMNIRATQVDSRISILEYKVESANDVANDEMARIAAVNAETAGLTLRLDDTQQQASGEIARIAALDTETADLTRRELSLEQSIRPRQLSAAQINDVIATWKAYSGRSVTLWSYGIDIEGGALSEQIRECLTGAHLVVINNIGRAASDSPVRIGIQIAGADKRLVAAIYNGLHKISGLETTEIELSDSDKELAIPAEIFVGMKPLAPKK